jgi:hypothetical protein
LFHVLLVLLPSTAYTYIHCWEVLRFLLCCCVQHRRLLLFKQPLLFIGSLSFPIFLVDAVTVNKLGLILCYVVCGSGWTNSVKMLSVCVVSWTQRYFWMLCENYLDWVLYNKSVSEIECWVSHFIHRGPIFKVPQEKSKVCLGTVP